MSVTAGDSFVNSGSVVSARALRHDLAKRLRILAELHAAGPHVRAADVQLEAVDPGDTIESRDHFSEVLDAAANDVHENARLFHALCEPRQVLASYGLDAGVRQPDGVEHARTGTRRLAERRRRGAVPC